MKKAIVIALAMLMIGVAMAGCLEQNQPKKNKPPIADFKVDIEKPTHNELINFDASNSTDPDKKDKDILEYEWDFGDDTKVNKSKSAVTTTHYFEKDGTYKVTLFVYDKRTLGQKVMNITVTNRAPVIDNYFPVGDVTVQEGSIKEFGINATDKPNDDLLINQWSIDGVGIDGETGKIFQYRPSLSDEGEYEVVVKVSDINGGSVSHSWNVTVTNLNQAPKIVSYSPTDLEVSVAEETTKEFKVTAVDEDGDPLTYSWYVDDVPITGQTATSFIYAPTYNDSGSYVVKVGITDNNATTYWSWNVTVTDTNRAPIITAFTPTTEDISINETDTASFSVTAEDPDGDILDYVWKLDTDIMAAFNGLSSASFTPDLAMAGEYSITVTVLDGRAKSASHAWTVTVGNTNQAPVINSFDPVNDPINTDEVTSVDFEVSATDPDGDIMSYQWYLNGTAVSGATTSSWTFVPTYDMGGTTSKVHKVKVKVNDPFELNATKEWGVVVANVNRPPVAQASVNMTKPGVGLEVEFDASASTDPDGQTLTFTWNFGDGSTNQNGNPVSHTYKKPGIYTATVTVSDSLDEDTAQVVVDVNITESWVSNSYGDVSPVLVEDVDNDGIKELIFGAVASSTGSDFTGYLYILDATNHNQEFKSADIGAVLDITIDNLDADPAKEIVVGTWESITGVGSGGDYSGYVRVFDGLLHSEEFVSGDVGMVRAVGIDDMDNDAELEIVALHTDSFRISGTNENYYGNLSIYGYSGSFAQEWTSTNLGGSGMVLAIDDLDDDNYNETVFGTLDYLDVMTGIFHGSVRTLGYTGATYVVENTNPNLGMVLDLTLGDPDSDTDMEVIVGDYVQDKADNREGYVYVLSSTLTQEWKSLEVGAVSCVEVLDADGDSINELIFGVDYNYTEDPNVAGQFHPEGYLYILNGQSHNQKFKSADIGAVTSIAFGDLDGNGKVEIIVGTLEKEDTAGNYEGYLYVFWYNLSKTSFEFLWKSAKFGAIGHNGIVSEDVDGDGNTDIVFGTSEKLDSPFAGKLYVYTNENKP